jgi:GNAT superfamily N-acetyltransferase
MIRMLEPAAADDERLVGGLTDLVNGVYAAAEEGLWRDGATRITAAELAGLVGGGEIAVAERDGAITGIVRVHDVAPDIGEFGLLAADPAHRGVGIGRALVDFAEAQARERGLPTMQLELLVAVGWTHPGKRVLRDWYARRGYRLAASRRVEEIRPHLTPLLATPCAFEVHRKAL